MFLRSLFSADNRPSLLLILAWLSALVMVAAGTILAWHQGQFWTPLLVTAGILIILLLALCQGLRRQSQLLEQTRSALRQETDRRLSAVADLERIASNDPLTGLANRHFFMEDLDYAVKRAHQTGEQIAVIALDLDGFQTLNNTMGHDYGDQLLVAVAERLRTLEDSNHLFCRASSDDFYLRCYPLSDLESLIHLMDRVRDLFRLPIRMEDEDRYLSASIGVVLFPDHVRDAQSLIASAEAALNQAAELPGTRYQFYNERLHEQIRERMELHWGLHDALEQNRFHLRYQPQQDMATGEWVAVEATLSWDHPERGELEPESFMEAALETGLASAITSHTITLVSEQLRRWRHRGALDLTVAVNLYGPELDDSRLVAHIAGILKRNEVAPETLELELAEDSLAHNTEQREQRLRALSELGLPISIDHFGQGTASLAWVRDFPVHQVKIEPGFVRRVTSRHNDSVIVRAIIHLAHNLGMQVTATGVDTDAHLTFINAHRCDFAQGERISPALAPDELAERIGRKQSNTAEYP
ncbi:EAL domain-containing protein [Salicola sp. Rm-C-2C1-2]|uniref:putative bifunctional diguanylate cyclase/phosphodiesterase n=1 Tax=Salicola sp. Rm-C-2C1-2 TaxID=3141321 RepID=UPI0032E416B2